jgi:hypothetical protein
VEQPSEQIVRILAAYLFAQDAAQRQQAAATEDAVFNAYAEDRIAEWQAAGKSTLPMVICLSAMK